MTAPARIHQADYDRAVKAAASAGQPARVIVRLEKKEIEIIIGAAAVPDEGAEDEWGDDDV